MTKNYSYGWIKDLPDSRDHIYKIVEPSVVTTLPSKVDLRSTCPPVVDQGQLGSCHDSQTEVLTNEGWKYFIDLKGSEKLATVNPKTSELFYEQPTRFIRMLYSGPMICADNCSLNFKITPNHQMLVRKWNESQKKLEENYSFIAAKDIGWYCGLMNRVKWNGIERASDTFSLKGVHHKTRPDQRIAITSDGRQIIGQNPEHRISIRSTKNLSIDKKEQIFTEEYSDEVFCAEVPTYHTLVTRRNGLILISGNCTANALAGAVGFLENKDNINPEDAFSRLFIYYNERVLENTIKQDSGAQIRDGIKTMADKGACYETTWPYNVARFTKKPSCSSYKEGKKHLILEYQRILSLDQMKHSLANGYPFVFGFTVYDSFESDEVAKTGIVPMPNTSTEQCLGGHAVMAIGYDDTQQRFIVRNSWGTSWGMQGYFTIPYAYLANSNLASDFWFITKAMDM